MKVYESKIFLLILDDETKAIVQYIHPVKDKLFVCKDCKKKL